MCAHWHVVFQKRFQTVTVERAKIEVSVALPSQAFLVVDFVVLLFCQPNPRHLQLTLSTTTWIATVCADSHFFV